MSSVDRVVQQAAMLDPGDYLEWCDTLDDLDGATDNLFSVKTCRWGVHSVVTLEKFYWPDDPAVLSDGHVIAYKEPGAYIEDYYIFAVNRKTHTAWAVYGGMEAEQPEMPPFTNRSPFSSSPSSWSTLS